MKDVMHVMTSVEEDYIYKKKSVVLRLEQKMGIKRLYFLGGQTFC